MKSICRLFVLGVLLGSTGQLFAAEETGANDLRQIIAAAASYQSGDSLGSFRRIEEAVRESHGHPAARREVESGLIELVGTNSTFEARRFACKQLGIIGSQAALPALANLLGDPETTGIACLALTTYPPGKADEVLRAALPSATGVARIQLINTLGDRKDPKSVAPLSRHALGSDPEAAEAAISSLGKIGTPAAWKTIQLVRAKAGGELNDALTDAMLRCAENLNSSGNSKTALSIYEEVLAKAQNTAARRSALAVLLRLEPDGGKQRILEVLSGKDDALMPVAIASTALVKETGASEQFAALMHHLRPDHQALLVEALAARGDDGARLELAKSLSSPEPLVRRAAVGALGRMGDPYFISLLAGAAASSSDPEIGKAVEGALVSMKGGAETDKRLIAHLKNSAPKARVPLITAVARRQGAAASAVLLEEAGNSDPAVAKAAFRALARTGTGKDAAPVLAKLVSLYDAGVRTEAESTAAQLLGRIEKPAERSAVVREELARATTRENRIALLNLLPDCGDAAALAALKAAVKDPESEIQQAAVRALASWPDDSVWDELMALYRKPGKDGSRELALRGLTRLLGEQNAKPDATLIERYKQVLASARSEADFRLVLGVIGGAAHPDALPLVLPLLSNNAVHTEAAMAAAKIIEDIKAQHPQVAEEAAKRLEQKR